MINMFNAFHGDEKLRTKFLGELQKHADQDAIMRGTYGLRDGGKWRGCAVACSLRSLDKAEEKSVAKRIDFGDHADLAKRLGIPLELAYLEDRIFESIDPALAMKWPMRFGAAIKTGADLSLVWPKLAIWLLTDAEFGVIRFAKDQQLRDAIAAVGTLHQRWVDGAKPPVSEFLAAREACRKARRADDAAAAYAAYAADAADDAAYAAYAADAAADADAAAYAADAADAAAYAADADAADDAARKAHFARIADKLIEIMEAS